MDTSISNCFGGSLVIWTVILPGSNGALAVLHIFHFSHKEKKLYIKDNNLVLSSDIRKAMKMATFLGEVIKLTYSSCKRTVHFLFPCDRGVLMAKLRQRATTYCSEDMLLVFFLPVITHFIVQEKVFQTKTQHGMNEQCAHCLQR